MWLMQAVKAMATAFHNLLLGTDIGYHSTDFRGVLLLTVTAGHELQTAGLNLVPILGFVILECGLRKSWMLILSRLVPTQIFKRSSTFISSDQHAFLLTIKAHAWW